jgi:hypothetical protein
MSAFLVLKTTIAAKMTQIGLKMIESAHAKAAPLFSDQASHDKVGDHIAVAHTNLQKAARLANAATPRTATPVLASVGGDKK